VRSEAPDYFAIVVRFEEALAEGERASPSAVVLALGLEEWLAGCKSSKPWARIAGDRISASRGTSYTMFMRHMVAGVLTMASATDDQLASSL